MTVITAETVGQLGGRSPAIPSLAELEFSPEMKMTADAVYQRDLGREAVKNVLSGKDHRRVVLAGPCALAAYQRDIQFDVGIYDGIEFQDLLNADVSDRILKQFGPDTNPSSYIDESLAAVLMRMGLRKPRSGHGWAGLLATDPVTAKFLVTKLANHGAELSTVPMSLATELTDPGDYEINSRFGVLWSGARHDRVTTLRHIASAPLIEEAGLDLINKIMDTRVDPAKIVETVKSIKFLYQVLGDLAVAGSSDIQTRYEMLEAVLDYNRPPFLFKIGEGGNPQTAIDGMEVAAHTQTNTFTGKDGRMHGPVDTLGNPYTGIIFRGGNIMTPEALREDLINLQRQIDLSDKKIVWGVDYSHGTAMQANGGEKGEEGQIIAHEIVIQEIAAGRIDPKILLIESHIKSGNNTSKKGEYGKSRVDKTVDYRSAASMIVDIAELENAA